MDKKVCSTCKISKLLSDFYKSTKTKCGLKSQCKECHNKKANDWNKENLEHGRRYSKKNLKKMMALNIYRTKRLEDSYIKSLLKKQGVLINKETIEIKKLLIRVQRAYGFNNI